MSQGDPAEIGGDDARQIADEVLKSGPLSRRVRTGQSLRKSPVIAREEAKEEAGQREQRRWTECLHGQGPQEREIPRSRPARLRRRCGAPGPARAPRRTKASLRNPAAVADAATAQNGSEPSKARRS